MKFVRIVLGVLVALYALMGLYNFGTGAAVKAGAMALPAGMAKYGPLIEAMAWWHVAALLITMLIYLVAAWGLVRGGKALVPYLAAAGLDIALLAYSKTLPIYRQIFSPAEMQMEVIFVCVILVGLAIVWWTERGATHTAAPV